MRQNPEGPLRSRIFYGWVIVGGAFVSHLLSYGVLTVAFGIFFPFMAEALHLGRGMLAGAGVMTRLTSAALAPLMGSLVDRRGPRLPTALGVLSLAAGTLVLATAHDTWHVFLGYGVVMAVGSVALGELTGDSTVARWFVRRRGRALAVATMGLSSAGIVVPLPLAFLITRVGWRLAWVVLGAVVLVLGLGAATVMRRAPEDHGFAPDGAPRSAAAAPAEVSLSARQATRTRAFWLLVLSTNLAGLALFGVNLHLLPRPVAAAPPTPWVRDDYDVALAVICARVPEGHEFSRGCFNQRGRCGSYRGPRGVSTRSRARVISSNCWRNAPRMCREL